MGLDNVGGTRCRGNFIPPAEHLAKGYHRTCVERASFPGFTRFNGSTDAGAAVAMSYGLFYIQDLAGDPISVHMQHGSYCMALTSSERLFLQ